LNAYVQTQARKLADTPLSSVIEAKRLMKGVQSKTVLDRMDEEIASCRCPLQAPAAQEALGAFMAKRKPDFLKI